MTIGDLVKYHPDEYQNQVPGLIVGLEPVEASPDYLHVQWFDWAPGELAVESPRALVVISSSK
jgi:hypothetical protein